jgi:hypothetical protein
VPRETHAGTQGVAVEMAVWRFAAAAGRVALLWLAMGAQASSPSLATSEFEGQTASAAVHAVSRWAALDGDAVGRPFVVVDKLAARVFVFRADGSLAGSAAALLGQALGDKSAPGVGDLVASGIPVALRTTPAGRFESEPGRNLQGEALVWVDYDAAVAIHRLRPAPARERRPQRLASPTPHDNRISLGCIVVDGAFYDSVVAPLLGKRRGVVYVLPDSRHWTEVFSDAAGA